MKNTKKGGWIVGALAMLVCFYMVCPLALSSRRPKQLSFKIRQVYAFSPNVKQALNVSLLTRDFVVSEGPCAGKGCNGGILTPQLLRDVKDTIPGLKDYRDYDAASTTLIWLYQVEPQEVTRRNDLFGEDTVTIIGRLTKQPKVYFAFVPQQIVEPRLHWVYVQTKDEG